MMFEERSFDRRLRALQKKRNEIFDLYQAEIDEAIKSKSDKDTIGSKKYDQWFECDYVDKEISELQTNYYISLCQQYHLAGPRGDEWVPLEDSGPFRHVTAEAIDRLRDAVRVEKKARWEQRMLWLPILGALTGLAGAFIGAATIWHTLTTHNQQPVTISIGSPEQSPRPKISN